VCTVVPVCTHTHRFHLCTHTPVVNDVKTVEVDKIKCLDRKKPTKLKLRWNAFI
jgi:hypothetical protein